MKCAGYKKKMLLIGLRAVIPGQNSQLLHPC